jgi:hypothetical protein
MQSGVEMMFSEAPESMQILYCCWPEGEFVVRAAFAEALECECKEQVCDIDARSNSTFT